MARSMSRGRTVARPAQGNNRGFREDAKWNPAPQPAPPQVSTGSLSHPKSTGRWNPKPQAAPGTIQQVGPAA